jgi:hypothetical protein
VPLNHSQIEKKLQQPVAWCCALFLDELGGEPASWIFSKALSYVLDNIKGTLHDLQGKNCKHRPSLSVEDRRRRPSASQHAYYLLRSD